MAYEIKAIVNVTGTHCCRPDGEDCSYVVRFCDSEDGRITECGLFLDNIDDPQEVRTCFVNYALRCKACLEAEKKFHKEGLQEIG